MDIVVLSEAKSLGPEQVDNPPNPSKHPIRQA
jgi:hypothetical protein